MGLAPPCPSPPWPSTLCGNPGGPGRAQFVAGLGLGSASVAWHLSEWALASVGGFSGAVARVLQRSTARSPADSCAPPGRCPRTARLTRPGACTCGLSRLRIGVPGRVHSKKVGWSCVVLGGLGASCLSERLSCGGSGGPASGSAHCSPPCAGACRAVGSVGRGLLGAVGLPLAGALNLVAAASAGAAATAGVSRRARPRRGPRPPGAPPLPRGAGASRALGRPQGRAASACQLCIGSAPHQAPRSL